MKHSILLLMLSILLGGVDCLAQVAQQHFKHGNSDILFLEYGSDGTSLFSASFAGTIAKWNTKTGKRVGFLDLDATKSESNYTIAHLNGMSVSSRGDTIAISYNQTSVANGLLQMDTIDRTALIDGKNLRVKSVLLNARSDFAFSPDGQTLATIGLDAKARIWSVEEGKEIRHFLVKDVGTPLYTPDGKKLVVAIRTGWSSKGPMVVVYDIRAGKVVQEIPERHAQITGLAMAPDGKTIAIGGYNGGEFSLKLWSLDGLDKPEPLELLTKNSQLGYNIIFSSDGKLLASSGFLNCCETIAIRRVSDNKIIKKFVVSSDVKSIAFSPDGKRLAYGTQKGEIFAKNL